MRRPKTQKPKYQKSYFAWPDGETYFVEHPVGTTVSDKEAQEAYARLRAKASIQRNEAPSALSEEPGSPTVPGVPTVAGKTPRGGGQRRMLSPEEQERRADAHNAEANRLLEQRDIGQKRASGILGARIGYSPQSQEAGKVRAEAAKGRLSQMGVDPNIRTGNTLDRAAGLLLNRLNPVGTPETDRLARMPLTDALSVAPPGDFWEMQAPGITQEIAKTPGAYGALNQFASGLLSPTNAAITLGTMGLGAASPLLRGAALARAVPRFRPVAGTPGLVERVPVNEPLIRGLSAASEVTGAVPRVLGGYFGAQGVAGAAQSLADTETLARDPQKYATTAALNSLLAALGLYGSMRRPSPRLTPEVLPFAEEGLPALGAAPRPQPPPAEPPVSSSASRQPKYGPSPFGGRGGERRPGTPWREPFTRQEGATSVPEPFTPRPQPPSREGLILSPSPPTPPARPRLRMGGDTAPIAMPPQEPSPPAAGGAITRPQPGSTEHAALSNVSKLSDLLAGALESKEAARQGAVKQHYNALREALAPLGESLPELRRTDTLKALKARQNLSALVNRLEAKYGDLGQYHPENIRPDDRGTVTPAQKPIREEAQSLPARGMDRPATAPEDPFAETQRGGGEIDAVQVQSPGARVLREERPEVELQGVREEDQLQGAPRKETEEIARKEKQEYVAPPSEDRTSTHVYGKEGSAFTPRNREVKFKYALVPLDNLITSHTESGGALLPNDRYDRRLQNRNRSRAGSVEQIASIAGNLNPKRLLDSATLSEGAPVIGTDNMVEGGNGRVLALRRGFSDAATRDRYAGELAARAEEFGFSGEEITRRYGAGENPVLVRVREGQVSEEARAELAREMNEATAQRLGTAEQAQSDANRLTQSGALERFRPNKEGDITTVANRPFVEAFVQDVAAPTERNALVNSKGELTPEGRKRVENALAAAAYPDPDFLDLLIESDETRRVRSAILATAPKMALLQENIRKGERFDLSITQDIADAAKLFASLKRRGESVQEYLSPTTKELFTEEAPKPISEVGKEILQVMEDAKYSASRLSNFLDAYIDTANAAGNPKQEQMLVPKPPPRIASVLQTAKELAKNEGNTALSFDEEAAPVPAGTSGRSGDTGAGTGIETPRTGAAKRREGKKVSPPVAAKPPAPQKEAAPLTRQQARDLSQATLLQTGIKSGAQVYRTPGNQFLYRDPDGNLTTHSNQAAATRKLNRAESLRPEPAEAKPETGTALTLTRDEAQTAAIHVSDALSDKLLAPYEGSANPPTSHYQFTAADLKELEGFAGAKNTVDKFKVSDGKHTSLLDKVRTALSSQSLGAGGGKALSDIFESMTDAALGKIKPLLPDVTRQQLSARVSNYFLDGWANLEKEAPKSAAKSTYFAASHAYADTLANQLLPQVLEPMPDDNKLVFQTYLVQDSIENLRDRLNGQIARGEAEITRLKAELSDRAGINAFRREKDFNVKRKMADRRDQMRKTIREAEKLQAARLAHRKALSILNDSVSGNPLVSVNADGTLKSDARLRSFFKAGEGVSDAVQKHKELVEPLLEENFVSSGYEASGIKGKYSGTFVPKTAIDENGDPIGQGGSGNGGLLTPKMRLGSVPGAKEFTGKADSYMDSYTEAVTMRLRGGFRARFEREMYQQWIEDGIALEPDAKTPEGENAIRKREEDGKTVTEGYFNGKWEPASEYVVRTEATRSTVDRSLPSSVWMPNRLFHEVEPLRDVYRPTVLSSYFDNVTENLIHAYMIGLPDTIWHSAAMVGRLANARNSIVPVPESAADRVGRLWYIRAAFQFKNILAASHTDAERTRAEQFAAKNGVMPPSYPVELTPKPQLRRLGRKVGIKRPKPELDAEEFAAWPAVREVMVGIYEVTGLPLYGKRGVWINAMSTLVKWVDKVYQKGQKLGSDTERGAEALRKEMAKMNRYIAAARPLVQKVMDQIGGGLIGTFYQTGIRNRANFFQQPLKHIIALAVGAAITRILIEQWAEEKYGLPGRHNARRLLGFIDRTLDFPTKAVANAVDTWKKTNGNAGDVLGKLTADLLNGLYQPIMSGPIPAAGHRYFDHYPSLTPKRLGTIPLSKRPPNDAGWMDWRRLLATGIEGAFPLIQQWPFDEAIPEPLPDDWSEVKQGGQRRTQRTQRQGQRPGR